MANRDLAELCSSEQERQDLVQEQLAEVEGRLGKLYEALETGEFKSVELAPRITALFQRREELVEVKADAEEALRGVSTQLSDPRVVKAHVKELHAFLENSGIMGRKSFLRSFVERIDVDRKQVTVWYTVPMSPPGPPGSPPGAGLPPGVGSTETVAVLPFVHNGPP